MARTREFAALLGWFGQRLKREEQHRGEPAPLLDALLPVLEYTPEQLKQGGFLDSFLVAGIKARALINRAADELRPLGIHDSDLCLLLQDRMREQLKLRREKRRKPRKPRG